MPSSSSFPGFLYPQSSLAMALKFCGSKRASVEAWLSWWHEINRIPDNTSEISVAKSKLAWWSKAVTLSFEIPPQHPLLKKIAPGSGVLTGPPIDFWLSQLQALMSNIEQTQWMNDADLTQYIDATTGAACQSVTWLMGARQATTIQIAQEMSQGLHRSHIMFKMGHDIRKGRVHLPLDFLQSHGLAVSDLMNTELTTLPNEIANAFDAWQQNAKDRLLTVLDKASSLPSKEKKQLKPLIVLCQLHAHLLDDLKRMRFPMLQKRVSIGPLRKLWISHTAAWR